MAVIRKEMRSDFEWETCLVSSKDTWVSALLQRSKRHGEDARDEMRTGGSLLFNKEHSSPVGLQKHSLKDDTDRTFIPNPAVEICVQNNSFKSN